MFHWNESREFFLKRISKADDLTHTIRSQICGRDFKVLVLYYLFQKKTLRHVSKLRCHCPPYKWI